MTCSGESVGCGDSAAKVTVISLQTNKIKIKNFILRLGSPNEAKLSDRGWRRGHDKQKRRPSPASVRWSAWLGRMALGAVAASDDGEPLCWHDGHGNQVHVPNIIDLCTKGVERLRDTGRVQLQADEGSRLSGGSRLTNGPGLACWKLEEDAEAKVLGIALAEALPDRLDGIAKGTRPNVDVGQDDAVEAGAYLAQPRPNFPWLVGEADASLAGGVIQLGCGY